VSRNASRRRPWTSALLALAPIGTAAYGAAPASIEGRWAGGLELPGDFVSVDVTVERDGDGWTAGTGFPNQGRAHQPTRVERDGSTITFRPLNADGTVDGVLEGVIDTATVATGVLRGQAWEAEQPERKIPLVLVRTVPLATADADRFIGDYRTEHGGRVAVERVPTFTGVEVLAARWGDGESRTLFAVGEGRFIAGPSFEAPWPVEREVTFRANGDGDLTVRWRDDAGEHTATPARIAVDDGRIAEKAAAVQSEFDVASISVGVVHGEQLVYARSFGVRNRASGEPATPDTLYQIASVTKTFTATLLAILRDEGVVSLDDPVRRYLPTGVRLPATGATGDPEITLRHLVTHTSGLRLQPTNYVFEGRHNNHYTPELLYACLAESSLLFPAGSSFSYSNLGYVLLSHALANAADASYEDLLRTRIFEPLGMDASTVNLSPEQIDRLATHYWPDDPHTPTPPWLPGEIAGQGGVTSTVRDMAKYLSMQLRADHADAGPLRGATLREIQRPHRRRQAGDRSMGLGWFILHDGERGDVLMHSGYTGGNSSYVALSPEHAVGVCVLVNAGWTPAQRFGEWLIDEVVRTAQSGTTE
jgi:CubicO group peptidase (beta-lactamase class C family)